MDGENNGNPIKMDDLGVPLFRKQPYRHIMFELANMSWKIHAQQTS